MYISASIDQFWSIREWEVFLLFPVEGCVLVQRELEFSMF